MAWNINWRSWAESSDKGSWMTLAKRTKKGTNGLAWMMLDWGRMLVKRYQFWVDDERCTYRRNMVVV